MRKPIIFLQGMTMCLIYMNASKTGYSKLTIAALVLNFLAMVLNMIVEVNEHAEG